MSYQSWIILVCQHYQKALPCCFWLLFKLCKLLIHGTDHPVLTETQACALWSRFSSYAAEALSEWWVLSRSCPKCTESHVKPYEPALWQGSTAHSARWRLYDYALDFNISKSRSPLQSFTLVGRIWNAASSPGLFACRCDSLSKGLQRVKETVAELVEIPFITQSNAK